MKLVFSFFLSFFILTVFGQTSFSECGTHLHLKEELKNSLFRTSYQRDQNQLSVEELQNLNKSGTIYTIPVVFHVLHNGGAENISNAQIEDALRVLNRDYRKLNPDANTVVSAFQSLVADIEIEFSFATVAPNGECFSGITRTNSPITNDTDSDNYGGEDQVDAIVAGNDVFQGYWDPSKYLNIYVCKSIGGSAAGYTRYPASFYAGSMDFNGIFMLSTYIGAIGTSSDSKSRTLSHEVGHWLNLPHTWGSTNEPGLASNCNVDDGVADTPNTIGSIQSCILTEASCGVLANVENYMNYAPCRKMFTNGQKSRMRTALTSSIAGRNNLWQSSNLNEVGASGLDAVCKADFTTNTNVVCVGNTIDFEDASVANVSTWSWSFPGGDPSTSVNENPTITYNTVGTYSVSLIASNASGGASVVRTEYVNVLPETGVSPIQEGFEYTNSIPSTKWFVNNSDNGDTWELTNVASSSGSHAVLMRNSSDNNGNIDELESTTITLDLNLSASISFDYAFAKEDVSNNDRLTVLVSSDCGQSWAIKKILSGSNLTTAPNTSTFFIPNDTEWKSATINSSSLVNYLDSDFRIKFVFQSGGGNNLYLDNINIDGPVTIEENKFVEQVSLHPNPATDEVSLSFITQSKGGDFTIKVFDVVGKEIKDVYNGFLTSGEHQFLINTGVYQSGIYFVSLNDGVNNRLQKLIIK